MAYLRVQITVYAGVYGMSHFGTMSWLGLKMLQVHSLKSVLIFSILNHPCSVTVHCYLFGVSLSRASDISRGRGAANRPFYSCWLSDLASEWQRGWS